MPQEWGLFPGGAVQWASGKEGGTSRPCLREEDLEGLGTNRQAQHTYVHTHIHVSARTDRCVHV